MYPILFSIGPLSISSFGFFLSLAVLSGSFAIWRLAKIYDLDKEKILDLIFITFIVGLIGSRVYYVALNYSKFNSLDKIILINRYPGIAFWGGLFLGILSLYYLSKRLKFDFWLVADLATVGLFLGLAMGSIGCLLASCQYGLISTSPLSIVQIGILGKRFPIQIGYSLLYFLSFLIFWGICLRFHFKGKVAILGLMVIMAIIFTLGFFRGDTARIVNNLSLDQLISILLFLIGLLTYYRQSRRSLKKDLEFIKKLFLSSSQRKNSLSKLSKSWYNLRVSVKFKFIKAYKNLSRKLNVKANPTQFQ